MKFTIAVLLTSLMCFAVVLYLPWWYIAMAAFIGAIVMQQSQVKSFTAAFIAVSALWSIHALILDVRNAQLLSSKVAVVLQMGNSSVLIIIAAFVGGIVAGMAALTGSFIKLSFILNRKN